MIDPGTAALAGHGLSFLGGMFGGSSSAKQMSAAGMRQNNMDYMKHIQTEQWNKRAYDLARSQFSHQQVMDNNRISIAANDARNAGLHPLFALGGGISAGGGSPSFSAGGLGGMSGGGGFGVPESGSVIGEGLEAAGRAIGSYADHQERKRLAAEAGKRQKLADYQAAELHQANLRRLHASAFRDESEAIAAQSDKKRAEMDALIKRAPVVPVPDSAAPAYKKRPLKVEPRESHVGRVHATGPEGPHEYHYAPPSLGGDEINQFIWAINQAVEQTRGPISDALLKGKRTRDKLTGTDKMLQRLRKAIREEQSK